ncbi:MAG TPA: rhomboid family intramembrane serine protease [Thermoanaerobaculia bacterium]|nr:rhomboid family intramembrane serine protease [Thermoanaerobaculia bacterium]
MSHAKGENLRSVYVLLFLYVALFFLEHQDAERFAALFAFERDAFFEGELWRLITYQFTQAGQGWFLFPKPIVLFFTLLLLYIMGSALEEEWGTLRFLLLFGVSTLASAATAAILGISLLGSYFVNFSLLFVYAAVFPHQTFYLFGVMPVRIRWIAWVAAVVLVAGVFAGGETNTAALSGAVAAYVWFLAQKIPPVNRAPAGPAAEPPVREDSVDRDAVRNAARFVGVKKALATRSAAEIDRLSAQIERDVVEGVNICPPVDFKPENSDGYCIRCEGFAECSVRYLAMNRPAADPAGDAVVPEVS